jgi:hypothetical protein
MKFIFALLAAAIPFFQPLPAAESSMSWLDNGKLRFGVDLSIGGAVSHLSEGAEGINMINSYDWGRQIQMSFYSGPNPFVPDGATVAKEWKGLGWNPIQSGDSFRNGSKVLEHRNNGKELYVRCIPQIWPLKNVPAKCEFECWYQLKGNTVQVRSRLTAKRSDKTQYSGRTQELPAVYTNGPWYQLVTYQGEQPFTGAETTVLVDKNDNKGWPWRNFQAQEHWVALLDKDERGLGVYLPEACQFTGGFAGQKKQKGSGGPKDSPTGYMAPTVSEVIDHNIVYSYDYTLIFGSLKEIRSHVYGLEKERGLPAWHFKNDRQHWTFSNTHDAGWSIDGALKIQLNEKGCALIGPKTFWQAENVPAISIRAAFKTEANSATLQVQPYDDFAVGDWPQWGPDRANIPKSRPPIQIPFNITGDGQMRDLQIDLSKAKNYQGGMTQVRFALPAGKGSAKVHSVKLKSH